jgi:bla regulator protein blaR1
MRTVRVAAIAIVSVLAAFPQDAPQAASQVASGSAPQDAPAFEVASVKLTNPDRVGSTFNFAPGEVQIGGGTLRGIIEMAYGLRTFQILGGPRWLDADRYDISAKNDLALKNLSKEQRNIEMRRRLQTLLADRFQLNVHHETREAPEYRLVVAKGGSRLKEPDFGTGDGINAGCGVMKGTRTTMSNLAMVLSRQMERPVLDKTGLSGRYDFELNYTPENGCGSRQPDGGAVNSEALSYRPSIFTAIQEQLGLKLEAIRGPVEVIVIDSVEKPEPN